ncbi:MAG TPA: MFS transporter, partial [Spirochaetes bacterium]|nr:MFS transporter [Spirochaetota bacterium]
WGRRRPFILGVAVPFGIITWLLFTDFGFSPGWTKVYFIVVVLLYFTIYTLLDIPYTALSAEMTTDYDERTGLITYRAVFCQVASILGAALPLAMVEQLTSLFGDRKFAWSAMTAGLGLLCVFPILWTWRATRGCELFPEKTSSRPRDIIDHVFKNRTFRYTAAVYVLSNMGLSVAGAVMVYFMKYYMGYTENMQSVAFAVLFACTILWIPFINRISSRHGKRWAFIVSIGLWALVQAVGAMVVRPEWTVFFYAMVVLASGGIIAVTMTGWSMIPDMVEVDEFKTGRRREGLYFGVISFSRKIAVALSVWLVGIALSAVGYVPDAPQSEGALFGIRAMYAWGTAVFLVLSMAAAYLLPMTRERHEALKRAIALKNEGKPWDEGSIRDIL